MQSEHTCLETSIIFTLPLPASLYHDQPPRLLLAIVPRSGWREVERLCMTCNYHLGTDFNLHASPLRFFSFSTLSVYWLLCSGVNLSVHRITLLIRTSASLPPSLSTLTIRPVFSILQTIHTSQTAPYYIHSLPNFHVKYSKCAGSLVEIHPREF